MSRPEPIGVAPKGADPKDNGWRLGPAGERTQVLHSALDEYCQLQVLGQCPDPDEFCRRYPALMPSLRSLIGAYRCLDAPLDQMIQPLPVPNWPQPGQTFLHYSLRHLLGEGAFSRVYLATEAPLGNRLVAVKLSRCGGDEAVTQGRLSHPNIVPVYSVQTEPASGLTVFCMPYLGSATLRHVLDRVRAGPRLPERAAVILEAVQNTFQPAIAHDDHLPAPDPRLVKGSYIDGILVIAVQLADALAFIHGRGIFHRDLKPLNVLVTPQGKPMLLDFNLARDARHGLGIPGGTLPYMSPEQLRCTTPEGAAGWAALDARSDLFSLGVILYELLTGSHPFGPSPPARSPHEVRDRLLQEHERGPIPVRQGNARVDGRLARIVERCLAADPAQRFASAADLAAALRACLSWPHRIGRQLARRRAKLAAAGLIAFLPGAYFLARGPADSAPATVIIRETPSERLLKRGWAAFDQGQYRQASAHFDQARHTDAKMAAVWFACGRANQKLGRDEDSLAAFEKAHELNPDGRTRACQGYCASRQRLMEEAIAYYQQAIQAGYQPAEVYSNLAYCYSRSGRSRKWQTAKEYLDKAIRSNPRLQPACYLRAQADLQAALLCSDYYPKDGLRDIAVALRAGPQTADLHFTAAQLCAMAARGPAFRQSYFEKACDHLKKALQRGQHPTPLKTDAAFAILNDYGPFKELLNWPAAKNPTRLASQLIDPVPANAR
jgi:serine/threonine protein kinase/Tfp pilus assembly protein PilF